MNPPESIRSALEIISSLSGGLGDAWVVGGSAGLMLQGLNLAEPPRDLDIYADKDDAASIHALLSGYATDRPTYSVTPIYESVLSHYDIARVSVELVGGFVVSAGEDRYTVRVRNDLMPHASLIKVGSAGLSAAVVPLAHELIFNLLRSRMDRVEVVAAAMSDAPQRHGPALRALVAASSLTPVTEQRLLRLAGLAETEGDE
ncbi:hypothetical protein DNH61_23135 [Paenibacillus sambharensis]|uniref:Nucleotidyl transferase AbiEii/AbiGii toxin family protein n=1 Tax=Paenibacillus sambharensis TaxID=1803190 RepID=A0A2W1LQ40_9BACL|nr:hypothetical protein [Paenibacillus sambharensis]PZD93517.1 hypothetical protein DNH61_23135 [Paenibacillus sambharensis]